jgi:hypothetical protein
VALLFIFNELIFALDFDSINTFLFNGQFSINLHRFIKIRQRPVAQWRFRWAAIAGAGGAADGGGGVGIYVTFSHFTKCSFTHKDGIINCFMIKYFWVHYFFFAFDWFFNVFILRIRSNLGIRHRILSLRSAPGRAGIVGVVGEGAGSGTCSHKFLVSLHFGFFFKIMFYLRYIGL